MELINKYYRYELKYLINIHDYYIIKNKLINSMTLDPNADKNGFYHIRSLYFDDFLNSAYYDKINGVMNRYKYRIRFYNLILATIKLEKKIKKGNFSTKIDYRIFMDDFYNIINNNYEYLLDYKNEILSEFYLLLKYKGLHPVIIVDYEREAYFFDSVRITFDKNLRSSNRVSDIFNKDIQMINILENNKIILEVKYQKFIPSFIKNIIQNSRSAIAISKYILCRSIYM
ncbi:polyphosphate polymerase domain-containing protein [Marinitoga arctica]